MTHPVFRYSSLKYFDNSTVSLLYTRTQISRVNSFSCEGTGSGKRISGPQVDNFDCFFGMTSKTTNRPKRRNTGEITRLWFYVVLINSYKLDRISR